MINFNILPKVRKKAKISNRCNQLPLLTQDTEWESDKTRENIAYKTLKRSALSQQVTTGLQEKDITEWQKQITKTVHKRIG